MSPQHRIEGRRSFLQSLAALCAAAIGRGARASAGTSRVALVIGNNSYRDCPPLANAANDARAVAAVLEKAGFDVTRHIDMPRESMAEAIRRFHEGASSAGVDLALFYYAGHGVELDWHNYLLPVDARVDNARDLPGRTVDAGTVVAALPHTSGRTFVIVLDACRDNPFGDAFHPEHKGLGPFDAPLGSVIAFSTSPGSVASDGAGANGLYTENLARELAVPGLRLEEVFKRVRANVSLASRGRQIPWESTSLVSDVYIVPPPAPPSEEELERRYEEEIEQWNRVKRSRDPADWAALLRAFPNGRLSEIAQARLNALLAAAPGAATRGLGKKPPFVRLGAGLPVPDYFRRADNPFSMGTYPIDRQFRVGDFAVYDGVETEQDTQRRRIRRRVTAVDIDNDRVELNDGTRVTDLLGNPIKDGHVDYRVPFQVTPAELQLGRRWTARNETMRRGEEFTEDMEFQVVARERIRVAAGEFDAFRIEARTAGSSTMKWRARRSSRLREETLLVWEVPGLNFPVKQQRTLRRRSGSQQLQDFELVSLEQGEPPR